MVLSAIKRRAHGTDMFSTGKATGSGDKKMNIYK